MLLLCAFPIGAFAGLGAKVAEFDRPVVQMVRDPSRPRIYATTGVNTVLVVNTSTLQVDAEIPIGSNPQGLDISPDGNRLYVAVSGSTVAGIGVVDLTSLTALPALPTTTATRQIACGLNNRLYVVQDELRQLDATTGTVQATFSGYGQTGAFVDVYGGVLRITPDRKTLIYGDTGLSPSTLYAFDVSGGTPKLSQNTDFNTIGENGEDLVLSADGSWLCYLNGAGNSNYDIALIPTANIKARLGSFNSGAYPANGAFSPDGKTFYTAPATQQKVLAYDTGSFNQVGTFPIDAYEPGRLLCDSTGGLLFMSIADNFDGSPDTLRVYSTGTGTGPGLGIVGPSTFTFQEGIRNSFTLAATQSAVTWSSTALPAGISLDPSSGTLSGTPTKAGTYQVTLTLTDLQKNHAQVPITIDVQAQVTLRIVGNGSVTGVASGLTWHSVGTSLTLTATPDTDGAFLSWSGAVTAAQATIQVRVNGDATISANFAQLVLVSLQVNGPGTISPNVSSRTLAAGSSLSFTATANPGAHFVAWTGAVPSSDPSINFQVAHSPMTLVANFAEGLPATLTLGTSGQGTVTSALFGTTRHSVGDQIDVTATALPGSRFAGWTGDFASGADELQFPLQGDTALTANFVSFSSQAGTYRLGGTLVESLLDRASITVTVGAAGSFTATITFAGRTHRLIGSFAPTGEWDATIPATSAHPAIAVHLELPATLNMDTLTATLTAGSSVQTLQGYRAARFSAADLPRQLGAYTLLLPPGAQAPLGLAWGYARMQVSAAGAVTVHGKLGDGTPLSFRSALTEVGDVLIDVNLPAGRGFVQGRVGFASMGQTDVSGTVSWVRAALPRASFFRDGFAQQQQITGSRVAIPGDANLFSWTNGTLSLNDAGMAGELDYPAQLGTGNRVTLVVSDGTAPRLSLSAASSTFSGSFARPGAKSGVRTNFKGVLDAGSQRAVGLYVGPDGPGSIVLQALP